MGPREEPGLRPVCTEGVGPRPTAAAFQDVWPAGMAGMANPGSAARGGHGDGDRGREAEARRHMEESQRRNQRGGASPERRPMGEACGSVAQADARASALHPVHPRRAPSSNTRDPRKW